MWLKELAHSNLDEKVFITTLTKKMAEELNEYLVENGIKSQYLHSSVKTLERVKILENIQKGVIDVIVGVNLLREGLDIPEVSLVMILDADKEGFLRNETSLIQTIGRAARNIHGKVILFADIITDSIKNAVEKTKYRRQIQIKYNIDNNITPKTTKKIASNNFLVDKVDPKTSFDFDEEKIKKMNDKQFIKFSKKIEKEMLLAAKKTNFLKADKLKEKLEYIERLRN
jgi:excinuclease ABC subunit B